MNKSVLLIAFGVLAMAQLAAPVSMVAQRERVLRNGHEYKFETEPVDPYDAFRGRYVALNLKAAHEVYVSGPWVRDDAVVYAAVALDTTGFARFNAVTPEPPATGDYIKARYHYGAIALPFDRYYMNEDSAPKADIAYREHSRRGQTDAYVTVRVLRGNAVLDELFIAGKPVEQYLSAQDTTP